MIIHDVVQGSAEWAKLRAGMPTASQFHRIITPQKGELSKSAEPYMCFLLAEMMMGRPIDPPSTSWMERGSELEQEAADLFAFQNDVELCKIGFATNDEETMGCSPDRGIVEDPTTGVEIKVPKPEEHARYLIVGGIDRDHWVQVQGQMYIMDWQAVKIVSHHPEMPQAVVHVKRDEIFIGKLKPIMASFTKTLADMRAKLDADGLIRKLPEKAEKDFSDFLSNEDIEAVFPQLKGTL